MTADFDGPDCGEGGCQREQGHIGQHHRVVVETISDEWASLGNIECRCGDVFPSVEAMHEHIHLSHPNADHPCAQPTWTTAERRAVASQCGLPYGWVAHVKSETPDHAVVRASVARTSGGHTAEPLPCGHRSVQGTGRTPALAVARLAGWVRWHREDCAP